MINSTFKIVVPDSSTAILETPDSAENVSKDCDSLSRLVKKRLTLNPVLQSFQEEVQDSRINLFKKLERKERGAGTLHHHIQPVLHKNRHVSIELPDCKTRSISPEFFPENNFPHVRSMTVSFATLQSMIRFLWSDFWPVCSYTTIPSQFFDE
ncbi:hypothetical protein TNCV_2993961 [Trichonephila clavipes]|nr:hypothetical protein TNCV_2993961 [Trichonephila clavipes]